MSVPRQTVSSSENGSLISREFAAFCGFLSIWASSKWAQSCAVLPNFPLFLYGPNRQSPLHRRQQARKPINRRMPLTEEVKVSRADVGIWLLYQGVGTSMRRVATFEWPTIGEITRHKAFLGTSAHKISGSQAGLKVKQDGDAQDR